MHAHTRLHTACSTIAREAGNSRHVPARMCTHTHVTMPRYAACIGSVLGQTVTHTRAHVEHTHTHTHTLTHSTHRVWGLDLVCTHTTGRIYTHTRTYRHTHMRSPIRTSTSHAPGSAAHTHITHTAFGSRIGSFTCTQHTRCLVLVWFVHNTHPPVLTHTHTDTHTQVRMHVKRLVRDGVCVMSEHQRARGLRVVQPG